jgi:prevent-host-death family protein
MLPSQPETLMLQLANIRPLTDFKRQTPECMAEMRQNGAPLILTVNGRAEMVVQDAASYQRLLNRLEEAEALAGIRQGLADWRAGDTTDIARAFDSAREKLKARGQ